MAATEDERLLFYTNPFALTLDEAIGIHMDLNPGAATTKISVRSGVPLLALCVLATGDDADAIADFIMARSAEREKQGKGSLVNIDVQIGGRHGG